MVSHAKSNYLIETVETIEVLGVITPPECKDDNHFQELRGGGVSKQGTQNEKDKNVSINRSSVSLPWMR